MTVDDDVKVTRPYAKKYAHANANGGFAACEAYVIGGNIKEART